MLLKPAPQYVDFNVDFNPLPKYGNLSEKIPEFVAAEASINAAYSVLWASPDFAAFREAAGDADAAMPPGGPDRDRDIVSELLEFPARDDNMIELKVYKSPDVVEDATLMYRMHGGGMNQTLAISIHSVD